MTDFAVGILTVALAVALFVILLSSLVLAGAVIAVVRDGRNPVTKPGLDWYEEHWSDDDWDEQARRMGLTEWSGPRRRSAVYQDERGEV